PVAIDHALIDDALADDRVIEPLDDEGSRRDVKQHLVEHRYAREPKAKRNVLTVLHGHSPGIDQNELSHTLRIFFGKTGRYRAAHRVARDGKTTECEPVSHASDHVRHRLF